SAFLLVFGLLKFPPPGSFEFCLGGEGRPKHYAGKKHAIIKTTKMMTMWNEHMSPFSDVYVSPQAKGGPGIGTGEILVIQPVVPHFYRLAQHYCLELHCLELRAGQRKPA